jgi:Holliday junction DNA helicase RuvA
MLGYLRGQVLSTPSENDGKITLGIGAPETGIVGYSVHVPRNTQYELILAGKVIELFVHTHVREDQLDLYGFSTKSEKDLFLTLLSVNGIGPKGALSILSGADTAQLVQAIVDGDKALLTKIPGIGKKTAERMVLELASQKNGTFASAYFEENSSRWRTGRPSTFGYERRKRRSRGPRLS